MRKTIKDLLAESPETYDFREGIVEFKEDEDEIDRHIVYQATGIRKVDMAFKEAQNILREHKVFNKNGHADGCALIQDIYGTLWPRMILIYCKGSKWITGETMNSVNTTMNQLLKEEIKDGGVSIRETIIRYDNDSDLLKNSIRKYSHAEEFLKAAYTVGNFIPVPVGCNSPRGYKNQNVEDYWDLTLDFIYQWYRSHCDEILAKIVKSSENVNLYRNWLDAFGSWDQFVVTNFMQDFVHQDAEHGIFGRPKELWTNHLEKNASVLPGVEQLDQFFENAANFIEARSQRMADALRTNILC